jgi:thioredoxin 1
MSVVSEIQDSEVALLLADKRLVLIYFTSSRCDPSHSLDPILVTLSEDYKNHVKIVKLDIDKNQVVAQNFKVYIIPAILIFKQGILVNKLLGIASYDRFNTVIKKHL